MPRRYGMAALGIVLPVLLAGAGGPSASWLGQDGHDLVGPSPAQAGNDIQDVHLVLAGLPPRSALKSLRIKGLGGDEWRWPGSPGCWLAAVERKAGSNKADVFIEPGRVETGRGFEVELTFEDGQTASFWIQGGKADPNLRQRGSEIQVRWVGQDRQDWAGPGPAVGPDGFVDLHLALANLSPKSPLQSIEIEGPAGARWHAGLNPKGLPSAELIRNGDDPTRADVFFQPGTDFSGKPLKLTLTYDQGKTDQAAIKGGRVDPRLRVPKAPPVRIAERKLNARWLGQDGSSVTGRGDVHVALDGLPGAGRVVAAALNNSARSIWIFRASERVPFAADPFALPLAVRPGAGPTSLDLYFPPQRDESQSSLVLRLLLDDGQSLFTTIAGGKCDPALVAEPPAAAAVSARPGDDLARLVAQGGTVRLAKGTYALSAPLVLERPVRLIGEPGATLVFSQPANQPPWTAAIKIHCGQTALDHLKIRFAGPVRWNYEVSYGPAVIGTTDNLDQGEHPAKVGLSLTHLDLEGPPAAQPGKWEEATRLMRLVTAPCGRIADNTLRGGPVEFVLGPWEIVGNDFRGTPPGTWSPNIFSGHNTHDLLLENNRTRAEGPGGKTWRLMVLTSSGTNDMVRKNTVEGVGPRDDDTLASMNMPETILTEAYSLHFEGKPLAISADGRIVQIPQPQGDAARAGDVVAVVSGPNAGKWCRVAQAIDANTYLLEKPLPKGDYAITIATGFVEERFEDNTIDCRGSAVAADLVLVGNHYGTRVTGNHFLGGNGVLLTAAPTEHPNTWGWSHAPFFDGYIAGNTIEDTVRGGILAVEHGPPIKSTRDRVYMTVTLKDNIARWSKPFLAQHLKPGTREPLAAWTIGDSNSLDLGELVATVEGNRLGGPLDHRPGAVIKLPGARVNGQEKRDRHIVLPGESASAERVARPPANTAKPRE